MGASRKHEVRGDPYPLLRCEVNYESWFPMSDSYERQLCRSSSLKRKIKPEKHPGYSARCLQCDCGWQTASSTLYKKSFLLPSSRSSAPVGGSASWAVSPALRAGTRCFRYWVTHTPLQPHFLLSQFAAGPRTIQLWNHPSRPQVWTSLAPVAAISPFFLFLFQITLYP